jgi:ketosteroid isomerase-like protein
MTRLYAAIRLIALAMFAVPALCDVPNDAAVRATIESFFTSFNRSDASATASLWRADAVDININGLILGKAQLDERVATEFKLGLKFSEHKIDRIDVNGSIAWAAGEYTVTIPSKEGGSTQVNGAWLHVLKQEGGVWRMQAASFTRINQPKKE